jgi:hypothetical protein
VIIGGPRVRLDWRTGDAPTKPGGPTFTPRSTPQSPSWRRGYDETTTATGNTTTDTSRRPLRDAGIMSDYSFEFKDLAVLLGLELTEPARPRRHRSHQHHPQPPPRRPPRSL